MQNILTIGGFYFQFGDSAYYLPIPLTICGFYFANSAYILRILLTVADSTATLFKYTRVNNCLWIRKTVQDSAIRLFLDICPSVQQRRWKESSNVVESAINLILNLSRLQFTNCAVWHRVKKLPTIRFCLLVSKVPTK